MSETIFAIIAAASLAGLIEMHRQMKTWRRMFFQSSICWEEIKWQIYFKAFDLMSEKEVTRTELEKIYDTMNVLWDRDVLKIQKEIKTSEEKKVDDARSEN